ncbi:hypothetical protein PMAYCL1PPCAC_31416, partial [Pristionchus mayeri]
GLQSGDDEELPARFAARVQPADNSQPMPAVDRNHRVTLERGQLLLLYPPPFPISAQHPQVRGDRVLTYHHPPEWFSSVHQNHLVGECDVGLVSSTAQGSLRHCFRPTNFRSIVPGISMTLFIPRALSPV